jgi:NAD(P)-dependent dehydrogenase (short-subunit alcohol dehydrogenase family)
MATGLQLGIAGRIALITGGASGIGEATARLMTDQGAKVMIADKNPDAAKAVAGSIDGASVELDVRDLDAIEAAVEMTEQTLGPIDILVNCAGIAQRTLAPEDLDMSEWDRVVQIHLRGTYGTCRAAGGRMAARGRGAIVNMASVMGMVSGPLHAYGPAKAGIINLTLTLAGEWGPKGVRVNAIAPGFTHTPMLDRGFDTGTLDPDHLSNQAALCRLVQPQEIAQAVTFLASDAASAITGVTLPVDAGFLVAGPWPSYGGLRRP